MIYRSNLEAPDLQPHFKHVSCRPMGHSMGHSVLSDFADRPADDPVFGLYKNCGFWTHDEAAILYNIAKQIGGTALDIGSHTGWTAAHMAAGGCDVVFALDPMYGVPEFAARADENLIGCEADVHLINRTSNAWFETCYSSDPGILSLTCIDGDHSEGKPLEDAENALKHLAKKGVILLHDLWGAPVQEAVVWLMDHGLSARVYATPHGVACCWRGDFQPVDHVADPLIAARLRTLLPGFPLWRCS